jgi:hypothetical protein
MGTSRERRLHSREFKLEAVRLVTEGGRSKINSEGETLWKVFPLPTVASLPASPFHGASARCMKHSRLGGITPRGKPRGIIKIITKKCLKR